MLLVQTAFAGCQGQPAEVPVPALAAADERVVDVITELRDEVSREPEDGDLWGAYGVALDSHGFVEEARLAYRKAARLSPREVRWPYFLAALYDSSEPQTAVEWYELAIEKEPDYAPARVRLAETLEKLGRTDEARGQYRRARELDPENPFGSLGWGRIALKAGDLDVALEELERAYELAPEMHATVSALSRAYFLSDRPQLARTLAAQARRLPRITYHPDGLRAEIAERNVAAGGHLRRAVTYRDVGQLERALGEVQRAIATDPDNPEPHFLAADIYEEMKEWKAAETAARRALELAPKRAGLRPLYARVLLELGRGEEAEHHAREALREDPQTAGMHVLLGRVAVGRGEHEEAMRRLELAVEAEPDNGPWRLLLARLHNERGNGEQARRQLEQLVKLHPRHAEAWSELGFVLLDGGEMAVAAEAFERAVSLGASEPGLAGLVRVILLTSGPIAALDRVSRVVAQRPDDVAALLIHADLLSGAGRLGEAKQQLQAVIELQPGLADAWLLLGHVELGAGKRRAAATSFRRASALGEDPAVLEAARQGLAEALGSG